MNNVKEIMQETCLFQKQIIMQITKINCSKKITSGESKSFIKLIIKIGFQMHIIKLWNHINLLSFGKKRHRFSIGQMVFLCHCQSSDGKSARSE